MLPRLTTRFDQIPLVAVQIAEDGDRPVGLSPRRLEKLHTACTERRVLAREVVRLQEEPHAPTRLPPDRGGLLRSRRPGEEERCAALPAPATRRRDAHPPLPRCLVRSR